LPFYDGILSPSFGKPLPQWQINFPGGASQNLSRAAAFAGCGNGGFQGFYRA